MLLISSASARSFLFLSFIVPILAWNVPLLAPIFLKRSLVFLTLLFSSISLACSLKKAFLSLLVVLNGSVSKESAYNARDACLILGLGRYLEDEIAAHCGILTWKIPWTERPGGLQSKGSKESHPTERLSTQPSLLLSSETLRSFGFILPFFLAFASLLSSAICKTSSDNHFALLHFFFLGMALVTASCTMLRTSIHSSSGTVSNLNAWVYLFITSTV